MDFLYPEMWNTLIKRRRNIWQSLSSMATIGCLKVNTRSANVRIICSTNQQLHTLVQEGSFLPHLFAEFKECTICVPSLLELPDLELHELAQGYTEQAIQTNDFKESFRAFG